MTPFRAECASLSIGEIHVWIACLAEDDHSTPDRLQILDTDERARAGSIHIRTRS
jgi:hypothetical protein